MAPKAQIREALRRRVVAVMTRLLTKPLRAYEQRVPNDMESLKSHIRKGDVVLVEGEQRVSQVIKYLTQSSWSHSALYLGDDLRRHRPALAAEIERRHGQEARHLIVEAVAGDGVSCAPLAKYARHNIRICRPRNLRRDDLDALIAELIGQIGLAYDVKHILDLGRYFFPVSLIPRRMRRAALHFGGDSTREVICSTMLARAFARVGYPIVPRVTVDETARRARWWEVVTRRNGNGRHARYSQEDPALITPRDFDLSPYFDIVKFNYLAAGKFDYRQIEWADRASGRAG